MPIVKCLFFNKKVWALLILSGAIGYRFVEEYKLVEAEEVQSWNKTFSADCAIVLTGGPGRVREGFDLLSNQNVKKLIISGVYSNAKLRDIMPVWSLYGKLNENDVVLDRRSETTFGNAQQSLPIVETLKCRDILLVTSRTHMYRAYKTFKATYPENIYIQKYAIVSNKYNSSILEIGFEAVKSVFYSLWAF